MNVLDLETDEVKKAVHAKQRVLGELDGVEVSAEDREAADRCDAHALTWLLRLVAIVEHLKDKEGCSIYLSGSGGIPSAPVVCSAIHGLHRCEKIKGHDGLCECHCGMQWPNARLDRQGEAP